MARYSQICRLGAPDPVALSDLRRWAQSSLPQSNSPDLAFLSKPELGDHDLVTLGEGSSQKTWVYRLVETLAWRWLSTVSKCLLRNLHTIWGSHQAVPAALDLRVRPRSSGTRPDSDAPARKL